MSRMMIAILLNWACVLSLHAQDVLVMSDGTELNAKVMEINGEQIRYIKTGETGPAVSIHASKVFMIIHKDGSRETFKSSDAGSEKSPNFVKKNTAPEVTPASAHVLSKGLFSVNMTSYSGGYDAKKKGFIVNATVDIFYGGRLFSSLSVNSYQRSDKQFDYSKPNAKYWRNNFINFSPQTEKITHILFERYENEHGKGYGWVVPPAFFSQTNSPCSLAFIEQNPVSKETVGFGGLSHLKFNLLDCRSPEQRLLSAVMLWLDVNFGKSGI